MITVELSVAERGFGIILGREREKNYKENKLRVDIEHGEDNMKLGALGEIGVCKHLNKYPDLSAIVQYHQPDLYIGEDSVDVKTIDNPDHNLFVHISKAKNPFKYYILCYYEYRKVHIVGWAYWKDLFKEENIKDFGHGPTYAMFKTDPNFHHVNSDLDFWFATNYDA